MRGRALHLASRFFSGLRPATVDPADRAWVSEYLSPAEVDLWGRYALRDQAHTIAVARSVEAWVDAHRHEVESVRDPAVLVVAALLHDIGKVEAQLGLIGRVVATLVEATIGSRAHAYTDRNGPLGTIARYCDYPVRGATLLATIDSDAVVIDWAEQHHEPESTWSLPQQLGEMLVRADNGRLSPQH